MREDARLSYTDQRVDESTAQPRSHHGSRPGHVFNQFPKQVTDQPDITAVYLPCPWTLPHYTACLFNFITHQRASGMSVMRPQTQPGPAAWERSPEFDIWYWYCGCSKKKFPLWGTVDLGATCTSTPLR